MCASARKESERCVTVYVTVATARETTGRVCRPAKAFYVRSDASLAAPRNRYRCRGGAQLELFELMTSALQLLLNLGLQKVLSCSLRVKLRRPSPAHNAG
jgi:hypothetical protein